MKTIALYGMLLAALVTGCAMEDADQMPPNDDDVDMMVDDDQIDDDGDGEQEQPLLIAEFDNDSVQNPAVEYFMSPTGTRVFYYSNDISFPEGDSEDFVEFRLPNNSNPNSTVWITLDCAIDGPEDTLVDARIWEDGVESANKRVACNDGEQTITINNTKDQTVRIHFLSVSDAAYVDYTLTVKSTQFI
jgi:hypothetical protein